MNFDKYTFDPLDKFYSSRKLLLNDIIIIIIIIDSRKESYFTNDIYRFHRYI